jgi:hypothetical protein
MIQISQRIASPGMSRGAVFVATIVLGAATSVGAPRSVAAQISMPSITAPKQAALRAAAAVNAHTAAMQDVGSNPAPTTAAAPALTSRSSSSTPIVLSTPATAGAKPVLSVASHPTAIADKTDAKAAVGATKPAPVAAAALAKGTSSGPATPTAVGDSAGNSISVTQRGVKGEVSLNREVFSYDAGARRDPFISLMRSGDLRPMLSDLRLVTVLYDATGQNSIAVMRDQSTKDQYRVRVGQTLGRMRVMQIQPKQVVFTIEEVGFSRQEALALGDTTKARTP